MKRNNFKSDHVLTPGSLPKRCGTKKKMVDVVKQSSFQSFTSTDYVKSCKENIMSRSNVYKTG